MFDACRIFIVTFLVMLALPDFTKGYSFNISYNPLGDLGAPLSGDLVGLKLFFKSFNFIFDVYEIVDIIEAI